MPLTIDSDEVARLAEQLALRTHVTEKEAVRTALINEIRRLDRAAVLTERVRPIQERVLARPPSGLEADKAFYDWLSDDD
jgi:antitoxin VapB